ncbi:MAG TPA: hypothetical protein ENH05_07485 [Rhizobiales bacterium]|nr:hypothetical protein [Hyphomicrobiales bacterium]
MIECADWSRQEAGLLGGMHERNRPIRRQPLFDRIPQSGAVDGVRLAGFVRDPVAEILP